MRITCVIQSLACGGAERMMALLCDQLARRDHHVTLLSLNQDARMDFYPVPDKVTRAFSTAPEKCPPYNIPGQIRRIRLLRQSILATQPEVVISFIDRCNILSLLALRGTQIPVIASERTDIRFCPLPMYWEILRKLMYPKASHVVVQTDDLLAWVQKHRPAWKCVAIPNFVIPLPFNPLSPRPGFMRNAHHLVMVGRIDEFKQHRHAIMAFSALADQFPDWNLIIIGEGYLRPELESLIRERQLQDRIFLPGRIQNPAEVLHHAELFVLSSSFEGFPNALIEAMACGLPSISYDCPSGPRDIIRHTIDGWLVPNGDTQALTEAMAHLMQDDRLRNNMAENALRIVERFAPETIMDRWEALLPGSTG